VGNVAYRLQLPLGARLHNVFHVRLFKKYCGEEPTESGALPPLWHGRVCLQPEEVIKSRLTHGHTKVLVRWADQTAANATWVQLADFKQFYPSFKLAEELVVKGGEMLCVAFNIAFD
jgi:hypothetical protein